MKELFSSLLIVLLLLTTILPPVAFADHHETGTDTVSDVNEVEETSNTTRNIVKGTGLCVGGAIVGSIVPLFGTAVGCGIGVAWAWFTRNPE